eukprot:688242-Rhodomonas_salina.1
MPERLSVRRLSNSLFSLCGGTTLLKDGKPESRRFSATLMALANGSPTRELFLGSFLEEGRKPEEHQWLDSLNLTPSQDENSLEQVTAERTVPEVVIEQQEDVAAAPAPIVEAETQPAGHSASSAWHRAGIAAALVALLVVVVVYVDLVGIAVSLYSFGGRHLANPLSFSLLEFSEDFLLGVGFMIGFGGVTATCLAPEVGKLCSVQMRTEQEKEAIKAALVRRKRSIRRRASVQ